MTPQMQSLLEQTVNAIVSQKNEDAEAAFHEYLRLKTQKILMGESEDVTDEDLETGDVDPDLEDEGPKLDDDGNPIADEEGSDDGTAAGDDSCAKM